MSTSPNVSELSSSELEVLKVLWDHSPATVRDVLTVLHEFGRELAYPTVLTFLSRLEQKGFVRADKSGLAYVYRPRVTRERVTAARLKSFVNELFDGAAGPLVLQLVRDDGLSRDELDQLQSLIERLERARASSRKKKR